MPEQRRLRSPPAGDNQWLSWDDDMTLSRMKQRGVRRTEGSHESEIPWSRTASDLQFFFDADQERPSPINPQDKRGPVRQGCERGFDIG